jgi:predicted PurR-regulated permease PerM
MDGIVINPAAEMNSDSQNSTSVETHPVLLDPAQLTDRVPAETRDLALTIMATVAIVFSLQWAEKFFIPLLLGIIIAYTLNPLVVWLERVKIPRIVGTIIVMSAVLCGSAFVAISLRGQVQTILDQLPEAANKLSVSVRNMRDGQPTSMQKVQAAAQEIGKATSQAADDHSTTKQPATHVIIDQPAFKLGDYLIVGSLGVFGFISQVIVVLLLVFFLLLAGDSFKRKLVRLTGPSLSDKKITVHILDAINLSIQRYMFTQLVASVLLTLLTWGAFQWIGLENAGGWAIAAGVLYVSPYLGPALIAIATGMVGFMQFGSFSKALLVSGSSLAIATFVGIFVVTWMTGKMAKLNAVSVFIALLFWGWLWGIWGLLLAIPILGILNAISQHIDELHPVAELMRE